MSIDQLRKDLESARSQLNRIEGKQESIGQELEAKQKEAEEIKTSDPEKLREFAHSLETEVQTALSAVQEEVKSIVDRTDSGD